MRLYAFGTRRSHLPSSVVFRQYCVGTHYQVRARYFAQVSIRTAAGHHGRLEPVSDAFLENCAFRAPTINPPPYTCALAWPSSYPPRSFRVAPLGTCIGALSSCTTAATVGGGTRRTSVRGYCRAGIVLWVATKGSGTTVPCALPSIPGTSPASFLQVPAPALYRQNCTQFPGVNLKTPRVVVACSLPKAEP
eukprot:2594415-Rhodomonas_salina.1